MQQYLISRSFGSGTFLSTFKSNSLHLPGWLCLLVFLCGNFLCGLVVIKSKELAHRISYFCYDRNWCARSWLNDWMIAILEPLHLLGSEKLAWCPVRHSVYLNRFICLNMRECTEISFCVQLHFYRPTDSWPLCLHKATACSVWGHSPECHILPEGILCEFF